jgi:anti-sigma B factor antagonist
MTSSQQWDRRLSTETVTEKREVSEQVRQEQIDEQKVVHGGSHSWRDAPVTNRPYLAIVTEQSGRQLVVRLRGELDLSSVDSLRQVLDGVLAQGPQAVVVDLAGLGFADCGGLRVLTAARSRLAAQDGQLMLVNAQPVVWRLLVLIGLDTFFGLSEPGGRNDDPSAGASA